MAYFYMFLGMLARALLPWLIEIYKTNDWITWKWKYLRGQLLGVVIVLVALPFLMDNLGEVAMWDWQKAWLAGYAVAAMGRLLDKVATD